MQICDFEGSRRIGPPLDWDKSLDGECGEIFVCDAVDVLSGLPVQYTVYRLTDAEIDALRAGGLLRLGIVGMRQHPVFNLTVLGPAVAANVQPVPRGDLGGVLDSLG